MMVVDFKFCFGKRFHFDKKKTTFAEVDHFRMKIRLFLN